MDGQDAGEDMGVGDKVEGRWSHCNLHASCHIYSHILEPGTMHLTKTYGILDIHYYYYSIS